MLMIMAGRLLCVLLLLLLLLSARAVQSARVTRLGRNELECCRSLTDVIITWLKNGLQMNITADPRVTQLQNGNLHISPLQVSDEALYSCCVGQEPPQCSEEFAFRGK